MSCLFEGCYFLIKAMLFFNLINILYYNKTNRALLRLPGIHAAVSEDTRQYIVQSFGNAAAARINIKTAPVVQ